MANTSGSVACCPALFLSAPASRSGKTTITACLARLLHRHGKRVRVFKFGPDYLDPQILERGSKAPVVQLDLWMAGEEWCKQQIYRAITEGKADFVLIEGAMGLYDGDDCSADLAAKFGIPVALVIDVCAMAQTAAAIAVGLRNYRDDFDMVGANKCGSKYHGQLVRDALPDDLPLWAALKRDESIELPERHLGLVQPSEQKEDWIESRLESGADLLEEAGILPFVDTLKPVPFMSQQIPAVCPDALLGKTIAIARDDAFSFTYTANITLLQDMGAKICYFSPIRDDSIPTEATAVWLPGGYPELHAKALSENESMISSLKQFHEDGKPILADCGGFLYCMDTLIDLEGNSFRMAGLIQGTGTMKVKGG
mmetsp:Transcript_21880/g.37390  ORF Transcript_21880/g.37390 Transcript_21880/m.37390 type:complete len:369 (-) Transcript_21880:319-1425(-)